VIRGAAGWLGTGGVVDDAVVVVQGSRIAAVGAGLDVEADEIAGDWFLMPGVVDAHVHIGLSDPRAVLRGGVTAVRDMGWPPRDIFPLVDISTATDFDGPAVVAVGPVVTVPGGYPSRAGWCPEGGWVEVRGPDEAIEAVRRIASEDPAAVKVALNADAGPTLSDAELVAVVDAAHRAGLSVTAHVQGVGQTERALGAGVDELAHCPWTERLGDALVEALARSATIVSTLDIHSYGRPTADLDRAVDNLSRFGAAGGRVRYGTDLGNGPIPPGIHPGEAAHLTSAGLAVEQILRCMTRRPLEPGNPADLVGLSGDPFEDLGALGRVALVAREGRVRHLDRSA
jgi:imidazolonepropionase-like amidohydrolase